MPQQNRPGPMVAAVLELFRDLPAGSSDPVTSELLAAVAEGLAQPLRLAVAGRVKAGKSTLVNALVGRRVAATDVGECTQVVATYSYGFPERVVEHRTDGTTVDHPLRAAGPAELPGIDPGATRVLAVTLSMQVLEDRVYVDTPGLASASTAVSDHARRWLAVDAASRRAVSGSESMVHVLARTPREDDREVLTAFRDLSRGEGRSAASCVAVLGRADEIAPAGGVLSPLDPLAAARQLCERHAEALAGLVDEVLPVAGLWAQTARVGLLTEADADVLLALVRAGSTDALTLSAARFLEGDAVVPQAARARLLELLALSGVRLCLALVGAGCTGAGPLTRELARLSGVPDLEHSLGALVARTDPLKAAWAVAQIERSAAGSGGELRDLAEELRLLPALRRLDDLAALQLLAAGVRLPVALAGEVRAMALHVRPGDRLGHPHAGADELRGLALSAAQRWQVYANDWPRTGPDQEEVARLMQRSFAHLSRELTGSFL